VWIEARARLPKFVIHRGNLRHELRKQRGTGKYLILEHVPVTSSRRAAKPLARHFDVAGAARRARRQALLGGQRCIRLRPKAGFGGQVALLPALRFGAGGTCSRLASNGGEKPSESGGADRLNGSANPGN
jgi:hypothetical protein